MTIPMSLIGDILRMDSDDLNRLVEAIKSRRTVLAEEDKALFSVGDIVTFIPRHGRWRGRFITAIVRKINRKNLKVYDENNLVEWTVHPSFVTLT